MTLLSNTLQAPSLFAGPKETSGAAHSRTRGSIWVKTKPFEATKREENW